MNISAMEARKSTAKDVPRMAKKVLVREVNPFNAAVKCVSK
jgi:hypothetical protein